MGLRSEKATVSPVFFALLALLSTLLLPESGVHWVLGVAGISAFVLSLFRPNLGLPILLGLILGGLHYDRWSQQRVAADCLGHFEIIIVEIIDFPHFFDGIDGEPLASLDLAVVSQNGSGCQIPSKVVAYLPLKLTAEAPELGDRLIVEGRLKTVSSQLSPQVWPDQATALGSQRFGVLSIHAVHNQTDAFTDAVQRSRIILSHWMSTTLTSTDSNSLMQALLIGRSDALDTEMWHRLKRLGIAYVVVVSGLHIGLIALFSWTLLSLPRKFFRLPSDTGSIALHCVVSIAVSGGYALLSGWQLPAQRATMMVGALLLTRWGGLSVGSMTVLALIALIVLGIDLFSALSASFWLTFGVTATILWLLTLTKGMTPVVRLLLIQSGAAIAGGIASAFFFGELSLASVITNVVAVPIITSWCLPVGLLSVIAELSALPGARWLLTTAALPLPFFLELLTKLDGLTSPTLFRAHSPHWGTLIIAVLTIVAINSRRTVRMTALLLLVLVGLRRDSADDLSYRFAVIDIGQGTALVLTSAQTTMVFDLGGWVHPERSQATKILIPYLSSEGRGTIDHLLVSHGDADHSAGLSDLRDRFSIQNAHGFGGRRCRPGQRQWLDAYVEIVFLSGSGQSINQPNADSCTVILRVFDTRILIPGDIGSAQERETVAYWNEKQLTTDILLASHHGSKTSSSATWLHRTSPTFVIYSAALQNRFGHPHPEVTERVDRWALSSFNTARSGTVTFTIDARGISAINTMRTTSSPYWLALDY